MEERRIETVKETTLLDLTEEQKQELARCLCKRFTSVCNRVFHVNYWDIAHEQDLKTKYDVMLFILSDNPTVTLEEIYQKMKSMHMKTVVAGTIIPLME